MQNIKESYITGIGIIIIIYLIWRTNQLYISSIYDHILINFILICLWYICFSYRDFVMTRKRLSNYYNSCILEYKALVISGLIKDIYVRVKGFDDWYKLDYSLTISKDSGYNIYEEFISKNLTVADLLKTMNNNANSFNIGSSYKMLKNNYIIFKYLSLIFLLIFELLYWLIYIHINNSVY